MYAELLEQCLAQSKCSLDKCELLLWVCETMLRTLHSVSFLEGGGERLLVELEDQVLSSQVSGIAKTNKQQGIPWQSSG